MPAMNPHSIERKPTWWLLYAIGAVLAALVTLIEISVPVGGVCTTLEIVSVIVMFGLMLRWVGINRGRIELAEAQATGREEPALPAPGGAQRWPPIVPLGSSGTLDPACPIDGPIPMPSWRASESRRHAGRAAS
jgi:hypothetical protein